MKELMSGFILRYSSVARAKHYIPQWRCNTKVGIGVLVMDVMIGSPVSSKNIMKTMVVDEEMAQPIGNVA
jgi:hypothetical protein